MRLLIYSKVVVFLFLKCAFKKSTRLPKKNCLIIPKNMCDYPKKGPWRSKKRCVTIVRHVFWDHFSNKNKKRCLTIVRHAFWDCYREKQNKKHAWHLALQKGIHQLVIVKHLFWDCQASVWNWQSIFLGYHANCGIFKPT